MPTIVPRVADVAIVGAGPYGLSLAAHLGAAGVDYRIFGTPMRFWRDHVPPTSFLKSDGKSSDLIAPSGALPLRDFYRRRDGAFSAIKPIAVSDFVEYGTLFQRRLVPDLDVRDIATISGGGDLFRLTTNDGEVVTARRVVLAIGINAFRHIPDVLAGLPDSLLSHSAAFGPVAHLAKRRVAVIGSGASAIDVAAVAHEAGADVTIISGRDRIAFYPPPTRRGWRHKIRHPDTGIGAGWSQTFYVHGPDLFRLLPARARMSIVTRALGPAPGWFMKDRIVGHVPVLSRQTLRGAKVSGARVALDLRETTFEADHVIAATGFHIDMNRLAFLDPAMRSAVGTVRGAPVLSRHFETSVNGLHVIGPAAAFSFGPVMRFVYGAGFAVPRMAGHLIAMARRGAGPVGTAARGELAAVR